MAKRPSRKKGLPAITVGPTAAKEATGSGQQALNQQLIRQAIDTLWFPAGISEAEAQERGEAAIALLQGIKPRDEIEGMLAAQMVGTHSAAMECLHRAMYREQPSEIRDRNLKNATKLMSIYARQIDVMNKHRGKGQQKVTVGHDASDSTVYKLLARHCTCKLMPRPFHPNES